MHSKQKLRSGDNDSNNSKFKTNSWNEVHSGWCEPLCSKGPKDTRHIGNFVITSIV